MSTLSDIHERRAAHLTVILVGPTLGDVSLGILPLSRESVSFTLIEPNSLR